MGKRSCFLIALESRNWCWILLMWKIKGRFLLSFVHQVSQSTGQEIVTVNTSQTSTNFQLKFWIILKFKYDFTYLPFYADIIRIFILTAGVVSVIINLSVCLQENFQLKRKWLTRNWKFSVGKKKKIKRERERDRD